VDGSAHNNVVLDPAPHGVDCVNVICDRREEREDRRCAGMCGPNR